MKKTLLPILFCFTGLISCEVNSTKNNNSPEVWKSELIKMTSETSTLTDSLKNHSQFLYLYSNGKAELVDSLNDGTVRQSETTWEIRNQDGKKIFMFGYGRESEGILGVSYPIVTKNETHFKMAFESQDEHHIWNLKRIKKTTTNKK